MPTEAAPHEGNSHPSAPSGGNKFPENQFTASAAVLMLYSTFSTMNSSIDLLLQRSDASLQDHDGTT